MKQSALATAVGITRGAMSRYESGDLKLGPETEERIAEVLGLDPVRRAKAHLRKVEQLADTAKFHLSEVERLAGAQA